MISELIIIILNYILSHNPQILILQQNLAHKKIMLELWDIKIGIQITTTGYLLKINDHQDFDSKIIIVTSSLIFLLLQESIAAIQSLTIAADRDLALSFLTNLTKLKLESLLINSNDQLNIIKLTSFRFNKKLLNKMLVIINNLIQDLIQYLILEQDYLVSNLEIDRLLAQTAQLREDSERLEYLINHKVITAL